MFRLYLRRQQHREEWSILMQTLQHAPLSYCASLCQISLLLFPSRPSTGANNVHFLTGARHALLDSQLLSVKGVEDERQPAFKEKKKKKSISKQRPALARLEGDAPCGKNITEPTSPADSAARRYSTLLCLCKDVIKSVFSFPLKCLVRFLFTYFHATKNLCRSVKTPPNHISHLSATHQRNKR